MKTEAELPQVEADLIAQLDALEIIPDAFIGIEIGRIGRQALDQDLLRAKLRT